MFELCTTGEYWLTTWGYKTELPVDYEKQTKLARRGVDAIKVKLALYTFKFCIYFFIT